MMKVLTLPSMDTNDIMKYLNKYWKTLAALTYLSICILDFIVIPGFMLSHFKGYEDHVKSMIIILTDYPELIEEAISFKAIRWMPFTLRGAGLFHIAFGAILTGSVVNQIKNGRRKNE